MPLNRTIAASGVFALLAAAGAASAAADIVPVSQQRTITCDANVLGPPAQEQDFQEQTAPGFGGFDGAVDALASVAKSSTQVQGVQNSIIDSCTLAGSGSVSISLQNHTPGTLTYGVGSSTYRVTFNLAQPAAYRVVGTIAADANSKSSVIIQQGNAALLQLSAVGQSLPVARQATLAPGQYIITFDSTGTASRSNPGDSTGSAAFDVRLSICFAPADLNIDGSVNVDDLLAVIAAWGPCASPGTCLADINASGTVNIDDLLAVLNAWGK